MFIGNALTLNENSETLDNVQSIMNEVINQEHLPMKWYIVHTYSGYENRARLGLEERIQSLKAQNFFGQIIVPDDNLSKNDKGEKGKKTIRKKFFPGYILVQMVLDDETWHIIKSVPKITGFVGGSRNPPSLSDEEVRRLTQQLDDGTLKTKVESQFEEGQTIRVIDGPFANFEGIIEEVKTDKKKLKVLVKIFGRFTPVELDFNQAEKTE